MKKEEKTPDHFAINARKPRRKAFQQKSAYYFMKARVKLFKKKKL